MLEDFVVAALGLSVGAPSVADLTKERKPVRMSAKGGLRVDLKRKVGVATRDVVIRRDDVTVCCDRAEAEYAANQIRKVTCRGRVVIARPDGTRAAADLAVFEAEANAVTLSGKARVWTKDARVVGTRIVYDIGADQLSVEGDKSKFDFDPAGTPPPKTLRACPPPEGS